MRAYRKRPWSELVVNMTPLIDVVFMIIIFFILLINFSEIYIKDINLPKADEAGVSQVDEKFKIPIVIKSEDIIFLDREKINIAGLHERLIKRYTDPENITIQIRADENISYRIIKDVMLELARMRISKVEFSAWKEEPNQLEKDLDYET